MFTWICPKCGGEVLPSYDDCPRCNPPKPRGEVAPEATAGPAPGNAPVSVHAAPPAPPLPVAPPPPAAYQAAPPQYTPPPPPPPQYSAPPPAPPQYTTRPSQQYAPAPQQYQPAAAPSREPPEPFSQGAYATPAESPKRMSSAVVAALAAIGMGLLLMLLYFFVLPKGGSSQKANAAPALEAPSTPATASPESKHPLAKHLEVTGVRITHAGKGNVDIRYTVVNHSGADLPELKMDVSIKSADKVFFEFPAKVPPLGPFETKDLKATVPTQLKPYELPDWQMMRPHFVVQAE